METILSIILMLLVNVGYIYIIHNLQKENTELRNYIEDNYNKLNNIINKKYDKENERVD